MKDTFKGKVITVTGASSGIGYELAKLLYTRGASLAISSRNGQKLQGLVQVLSQMQPAPGQEFIATTVDVSRAEDVKAWVRETVSHFGQLNGAANVAGSGEGEQFAPLTSKTDDEFDTMVDINLRGVFNCMRAQIPHMGSGSSIVNVSSGAAITGIPGLALYSAAKAALNNLSKTAAREVGHLGIRINVLSPGFTLSPPLLCLGPEFLKPHTEKTPLRRAGEPMELASSIAYLLSEESSFQTGSVVVVDGGYLC
ncbi:uncharacterized protein Z518_03594 [Rhinocladiella mackenziei CBS 650.93]|uniref:Ketoreductase domain-containing protein n=1 Tax=Rhinocladiella mackenziei CBS 650.93 TaxID=1442369 RepID=A0A0D2FU41_9EURO|nr:uncharacterized protein Z518_03594 [Rhinocladiella mackenziei CBS 650.93]KIX05622.1 hypothetical protein Z518_03594 [Rhinocladiella mackenziei CBS 650.93]